MANSVHIPRGITVFGQGKSERSSPFSPEGREFKPESRILHCDGSMTAEEEWRETKQEQHEARHGTRFSAPIVVKVKPFRGGRIIGEPPGGQTRCRSGRRLHQQVIRHRRLTLHVSLSFLSLPLHSPQRT